MEEPVQRAVLLHLPRSRKIDIEFNDIIFSVKEGRSGKKQILKGVNGKFKSGELTAIMGPSGAGKTTLLNILTGFQSKGMQGTINSEGSSQKKSNGSKQYRKESCYILQDDQLAPFFTVIEIMTMAADLKLGQSLSDKSKLFVIDDILETLGLMTCKETRCNKLSGGQKKRLSIALELIDNPPIMFLDEPTTGLDSSSSLHCISMLKALARGGRTIVCTIHQPSATSFELFDHVYVMAAGHCIYQGASQNTVSYLSSMGLLCPEFHNPADYLLEVANGDHGNFTSDLATAAKDSKWRSSLRAVLYEIEEERTTDVKNDSNKSMVLVHPPSEWNKFFILLNRSFLQLHRDWTISHLKLLVHIVIGLFVGLFFLNVGNDASQTMPNISFMLVTCVYLCYTSMMPAVLKFPTELPVLKKERFNNWYNLRTYYFAFMVADIPIQMLFSTAFTAITYFMSSQPQEWSRFFMFLTICMLLTITAESWGFIFGTLVDPINGTFLGAITLAFWLVLAGFLVFLTHMSKVFYIISHLSYVRFAVEGLVYSVYGHDRGTIPCPEERVYCQYTRPDVLLKEIGMNHSAFWLSAVILLGMIVILRTIAYCTLKNCLSKN